MRSEPRQEANGGDRPLGGDFLPALAHRSLTPLYDRLVRWTTREEVWRTTLLAQVADAAPPGGRLLDVGCGTGTFALALARRRRDLRVVGLDADEDALAIAAAKAAAEGAAVAWRQGRAERLPFEDGAFDVVSSSLFFHHLPPAGKLDVAGEIRRVLVPGGEAHVADWTAPRGLGPSLGFALVQLLDGFATTAEHRRGRLAAALAAGGLAEIAPTALHDVPLGTIGVWRARRAGES